MIGKFFLLSEICRALQNRGVVEYLFELKPIILCSQCMLTIIYDKKFKKEKKYILRNFFIYINFDTFLTFFFFFNRCFPLNFQLFVAVFFY